MTRIRYDELDYPGGDGLHYRGDEPCTGVAVSYRNGRPHGESEYRDGVVWGIARSWHSSGSPASET